MGTRKQIISNKRAGRGYQYKIAKRLGAKSVGTIEGQDLVMVLGNFTFSGEAKKRKKFIGTTFMNQATKNCPEGSLPFVTVHQTGERHDNDLIMLRLGDWEKIVRELR